jgi:hypothetical protein
VGKLLIVSGHQPNYLPWLGLFDKMLHSDIFIIEDNVQYEQQGLTNRNKVKIQDKAKWLTVPIEHVGKPQLINQVKISNSAEPNWTKRHWLTLKHNYLVAPFWSKYCDFFRDAYSRDWTLLIDLNLHLLRGIMDFLDIKTPLVMASSLNASGEKGELALSKCKALGGTVQFSGDGARNYLDEKRFEEEGIKLIYQDFKYPIYRQLHGEYIPNLSVVDYLFCTGGVPWHSQTSLIIDGGIKC